MRTSRDERVRRERASWLGSKASARATAHTRSRVSGLTFGFPVIARDAVARETPAAVATSASVGRRAKFTPPAYPALTIGSNWAYLDGQFAIDSRRLAA